MPFKTNLKGFEQLWNELNVLKNLFKSKRQREMEREIAIQRALALHRNQISKLEQHEKQYVEKALRAKRQSDRVNFGRLCAMVSQTINQRRATESQLLHFETILQKRDQYRLMNEFAGGLKAMAKSVSDVLRDFDAEDMLKDVEVSMVKSHEMETAMDLVLDRISATGFSESASVDAIAAEDIESLLSERGNAEMEIANIDQQIKTGLKAIEDHLTQK